MRQIGTVEPSPEWRVIVERFCALDYGEILTHAEIADAVRLPAQTTRYYQQTSMAMRVCLRDHDLVIVCVPKVGYQRLMPEQHGRETRRYVRLGTRRIKRGAKVVKVTPFELLDETQKKELEHSMQLLRMLQVTMGSLYRTMRGTLPPVRKQAASDPPPENADPETTH